MDKNLNDVDPELLENLDLLMNYETIEEEENWPALEDFEPEEINLIAEYEPGAPSDEEGDDHEY